jgi:prepilin signal peptidase PulO-like enzyme (type II secretory pathway)
MAHWPKTVVGNVVAFVLAILVVMTVVQFAIVLSGPIVWITLAAVALTSGVVLVVLVTRRRMTAAAYDLTLADAPSFADVLPHWNRHDPELPAR